MGIWQSAMEKLGMNKKFWAGKKVFVTGHTGFKGGWLTVWLKEMGAKVVGYSLLPSCEPNLFTQAEVSDQMCSIIGDIRDLDLLKKVIADHEPEIVFHLAAQPLVRYSYENPVETYQVNVMGTVNVLEAIRQVGKSVKAVIVVTTDKCYENREWVWGYRETDPMGGFDPYSNSKGCAELVASSFRRSFFSNKNSAAIATVRAGNVIGGGDWAEARLIPDLIRSFLKNETAIIRNPNAYRPWQYVLDLLSGYLILAEKLYHKGAEFADAWNFGPTSEDVKPVSWIADEMVNILGGNACWQLSDENNMLHEAMHLKLDCSKARNHLKWVPKMNLNQALKETVEWYKVYSEKKPINMFMKNQIRSYEKINLSF